MHGRGRSLDSLTGLRALAALAVVGFHMQELFRRPGADVLHTLFGNGSAGVSLFFVLSGFVLTWSWRQSSLTDFYRRRLARIYPAYLVALVAGVLVTTIVSDSRRSPTALLLQLGLLHAWWPSASVFFAHNAVLWTLSVEAFFYLLFPVIAPPLMTMHARHRRRVVASIALAVLVAPAAFVAAGAARVSWSGFAPTGTTGFWMVVILPAARLPEFILGIVLALETSKGITRVPLRTAAIIALATYSLAAHLPPTWLGVGFGVLVVACAQADIGEHRSSLRARVVVVLGVWSYSLYLSHQLVLRLAYHEVDPHGTAAYIALMVATVALAILVAAGLWWLVEQRFSDPSTRPRLPVLDPG